MKLDRNVNKDGLGKYALINLRTNKIEWGRAGEEDEFFVIKLKDVNAHAALRAYAKAARVFDSEFADEIDALAERSGVRSPFAKVPD
jgi:hypothetical protein